MKVLRRCIAVAVLLLLFLSVLPVQAASPIRVTLDGKSLAFDVPPALTGGRVMVPLRKIFESLGAKVNYDPATGRIVGVRGGTTVVLNASSTKATVNGKEVALSAAPQTVGGRTLVPLRFVSEALGDKVDWDAGARTVIVTSDIDWNAPALQAGWYRVSGTVKDARTNSAAAGVQVVARTDYSIAAGDSGSAGAAATGAAPATDPATGAPTSSGLGTSAPAASGPVASAPSSGGLMGSGPTYYGAPGRVMGSGPTYYGAPGIP
ncbi:MAG: copper amine oxidase N-terminal domain-containing protein, partial [Armatimonadetes bacterium]|nr:copper amine oxidase N-terminal domain-containing protein [Armatimonadota bacterium]